MEVFNPKTLNLTKYLFFTGKGGVGKTSTACATAVTLAEEGKKVFLVSTDPASNLQDVFNRKLTNEGQSIEEVPGLVVANLDPVQAAQDYKESVVGPYRGKLPEPVIRNMEEQLSGSCTVEIAAFNEFSNVITQQEVKETYDHIIFDTAPTGHTLRMLQLPSAWSNFISESTHGASCLGQLSGLEGKKEIYQAAVDTLANGELTTLILVTRPEIAPLKEVERASKELSEIGVNNQTLVINGVLNSYDDTVSESLYIKQQSALKMMPRHLRDKTTYTIPLRAYNMTGINNIKNLLVKDVHTMSDEKIEAKEMLQLGQVIDYLSKTHKKVIFTMGKGGVGKTTIAAAIAMGLSNKGSKVHLATTDPAAHLKNVMEENTAIEMSYIDEKKELEEYKEEVLTKARETMSDEDIAYIEEDLRSPCTQEIAVFRAFARLVEKSEESVVVIDTAPTGHTLLLLDSTQSYHKEIERSQGDIPESVKKLLPRLRNPEETEVIIVTLPEATPVYEAQRLEEDLNRAGIMAKWWVMNASLYGTQTTNALLSSKASQEIQWINKIYRHTEGKFALLPWRSEEIKGDSLLDL